MKAFAKILLINLGLLLLVALGAELAFGNWLGGGYGTLVIPRDMDRRFDVSKLHGGPPIHYKRDRHGLRGAYEDPSRIDILVLGGSTANEIFIDEDATWTATLAKAFAEEGRKVTVVNAGVDGQSTVGHLKNFELWFPRIPGLKARYVLVYLGINDHAVAATGTLNKQDHLEAPRRQVKQFLINNSAIYGLYRTLKGAWKAREADLVHKPTNYDGIAWTEAPVQPDPAEADRKWAPQLDAFAGRLAELARRVRAFGAEPIIVTQHLGRYRIRDGKVHGRPLPDGRVDINDFAGLDAFDRRAMTVCAEVKAICIDLARELLFTDGDHYDGLHTTPRGSARIGRFLHEKLKGIVIDK